MHKEINKKRFILYYLKFYKIYKMLIYLWIFKNSIIETSAKIELVEAIYQIINN